MKIYQGDALNVLKTLESESVNCIITSPPYWSLRDYGVDGQLGLEATFEEYIEKLIAIFNEAKRVLRKDGTCWVNIGDTYSGNKEGKTDNKVSDYLKKSTERLHKKKGTILEKSLCQIPSRFAIAMTDNGWILRNEIIWHKPNCMPSSAKDRFTVDFEKVFFFVKNKKYWFETQYENALSNSYDIERMRNGRKEYAGKWSGSNDAESFGSPRARTQRKSWDSRRLQSAFVAGNGSKRTKRCVWKINTKPFKEAHFATYPEALIEPMIKAGCPVGGIVLDPFFGSGTTGVVAKKLSRKYIGIELNPEYIKIAEKRIESIPDKLFIHDDK
jgi:site-specific DNA-methyltransferase (adenine-specific)